MDLTDLATVKKYTNLSGTNSDAVLASLVSSESQCFLDEVGRANIESQTYTEIRDGRGKDLMQLMNWPVTGFTSLTINGRTIPLSTTWNTSGYQYDALGRLTLIGYSFCPGRRNVTAVYPAGFLPLTVTNELGTIPASGAYTIQVQQPNWRADGGVVFFIGGGALTPVNVAPAAGQYMVQAGLYLFNVSDAGKQVQISYTRSGIPTDIVRAVNEMVLLRYRQRDRMDTNSMSIGGTVVQYAQDDYPKDVWRVIKKYKRYVFVPGF